MLYIIVKLLDWGEDGYATGAETAALRASFQKEVAVWHKLDHPNVTKVQTCLSFYLVSSFEICILILKKLLAVE